MPDTVLPCFRYNPEWRVLICCEHRLAIPPAGLSIHLYSYHQIKEPFRGKIVEHLQNNYNIAEPQDVLVPPSYTPAIDGLELQQGFLCTLPDCNEPDQFRTLNLLNAQKHRGTVHRVSYRDLLYGIARVHLQAIFKHQPYARRFFVTSDAPLDTSALISRPVVHGQGISINPRLTPRPAFTPHSAAATPQFLTLPLTPP